MTTGAQQLNKIIEPIQSRCVILNFEKLSDKVLQDKLIKICVDEKVQFTKSGLEALSLTADGDMRQALNNLQATSISSDLVSPENVFKICDQPYPVPISNIVR